jgi:hypothetical protein
MATSPLCSDKVRGTFPHPKGLSPLLAANRAGREKPNLTNSFSLSQYKVLNNISILFLMILHGCARMEIIRRPQAKP